MILFHFLVVDFILSYANAATLHQLILNRVITDRYAGALAAEGDVRGALDVYVVTSRRYGPNPPSESPVDLDVHGDGPDPLVLAKERGVVWGNGDVVAVYEGGPHLVGVVVRVGRRDS